METKKQQKKKENQQKIKLAKTPIVSKIKIKANQKVMNQYQVPNSDINLCFQIPTKKPPRKIEEESIAESEVILIQHKKDNKKYNMKNTTQKLQHTSK